MGTFWHESFRVAWFKMGLFGYSKLNGSIFVLYHIMLSGKFLWFGNSAWDFWGVKFWCRDFLVVLFESQGIFLGFDLCSHLIIPVTWSLEIQSTPLSHPQEADQVQFHSFPAWISMVVLGPKMGQRNNYENIILYLLLLAPPLYLQLLLPPSLP